MTHEWMCPWGGKMEMAHDDDVDTKIAATIAAAVEEQSVATDDISRNAAEASSGTLEVSSNIAGVGVAADQTRRATHVVSASAATLAEQSRSMQQAVAGFLSEVRAA